jgi:uncharacterized phage-associated protein
MPYKALEVANYFLDLAKRDKKPISPMKLQKLVYFAHGWNLALRNEPLLLERVEAWDYGPVIPAVYHAFKECGRGEIKELAASVDLDDDGKIVIADYVLKADKDTFALLKRVWDVYRSYTAIQLSNATHDPDGAWFKTYHEGEGAQRRGVDIPDPLIREEFIGRIKRSKEPREPREHA